jgi:hypothetical protein
MHHRIVEAAIRGDSARSIALWLRPPASHSTVNRYIQNHIAPVMSNATALKKLLQPIEVENEGDSNPKQDDTAVRQRESEIDEFAKQALFAAPALHIRDNRIRAKQERLNRIAAIVNERAGEMENIPGGRSGFLTRDFKGSGENMQEVYKFDAELFKAFDETEKSIAIELGQWQENTGNGAVSIQILYPGSASEPQNLPRVTYNAVNQIEAGDGDEVEIGTRQLG